MWGQRRMGVAVAVAMLLLLGVGATNAGAQEPSCPPLTDFNPANFSNPTKVDNTYLPLVPGSQNVLEGKANRGGGSLPHRVTFTVTDLTKVINGVRTVVVWDVDVNEGVVAESELAFWAQDDAGNVWNLGEYPEEYLDGIFQGAPSTWFAGLSGAVGGVHMAGLPKRTRPKSFYLQGSAPAVEFLDCAKVTDTGLVKCVPVTCYRDVLRTEETSPLDPQGGSQLKYHAPGVGIVQVAAVNDPEGETLVQVAGGRLDAFSLRGARREALKLEERGYQVSDDYRQTPPMEAPPEPPPPPPPPPPPAPPPTPQPGGDRTGVQVLSAPAARRTVRTALRARLRGWRIARVTCRLRLTRATCSFTARRRGYALHGSGTVSRPPAGRRALRYRLTARIRKYGCRPASSRRCTRTTRWSR